MGGIIAIKQVQNLASAITIGHLRQHGKSHININRRTSFVFSTGFTEQLWHKRGQIAIQTISITIRLIHLFFAIGPPCIVNLIKTITVKVTI